VAAVARGRARKRRTRRDVSRAGGDYVYLRGSVSPGRRLPGGLAFVLRDPAGTVATLATGFFRRAPPNWCRSRRRSRSRLPWCWCSGTSLLNYYGVRHWRAREQCDELPEDRGARCSRGWARRLHAALATSRDSPHDLGSDADRILRLRLAVSPVLFSYLGWNASSNVASEDTRPARQRAALALRRTGRS